MNTTLRFCQKLNGNLAVAASEATFILMNQTFAEVCGEEHHFYTGYTDREVVGEWRDVNTGDLITWTNAVRWMTQAVPGECVQYAASNRESRYS